MKLPLQSIIIIPHQMINRMNKSIRMQMNAKTQYQAALRASVDFVKANALKDNNAVSQLHLQQNDNRPVATQLGDLIADFAHQRAPMRQVQYQKEVEPNVPKFSGNNSIQGSVPMITLSPEVPQVKLKRGVTQHIDMKPSTPAPITSSFSQQYRPLSVMAVQPSPVTSQVQMQSNNVQTYSTAMCDQNVATSVKNYQMSVEQQVSLRPADVTSALHMDDYQMQTSVLLQPVLEKDSYAEALKLVESTIFRVRQQCACGGHRSCVCGCHYPLHQGPCLCDEMEILPHLVKPKQQSLDGEVKVLLQKFPFLEPYYIQNQLLIGDQPLTVKSSSPIVAVPKPVKDDKPGCLNEEQFGKEDDVKQQFRLADGGQRVGIWEE